MTDPVWTCGFPGCGRVYQSERGIRRHYILHHRHKYRRGHEPIYIDDDDEYERLCARLRRGQRHRHRCASSDDDDDGNGASRRSAAPVRPAAVVYSSSSSSVVQSTESVGGPQSRSVSPGRSRGVERPFLEPSDRSRKGHSLSAVGTVQVLQWARLDRPVSPVVRRRPGSLRNRQNRGRGLDQRSREVPVAYGIKENVSVSLRERDVNMRLMICRIRGRDREWPRTGSTWDRQVSLLYPSTLQMGRC